MSLASRLDAFLPGPVVAQRALFSESELWRECEAVPKPDVLKLARVLSAWYQRAEVAENDFIAQLYAAWLVKFEATDAFILQSRRYLNRFPWKVAMSKEAWHKVRRGFRPVPEIRAQSWRAPEVPEYSERVANQVWWVEQARLEVLQNRPVSQELASMLLQCLAMGEIGMRMRVEKFMQVVVPAGLCERPEKSVGIILGASDLNFSACMGVWLLWPPAELSKEEKAQLSQRCEVSAPLFLSLV